MVNAQEWLDQNYPKDRVCDKELGCWSNGKWISHRGEKRNEIKELSINYEALEGSLKLEGFTSLETLNCIVSKISKLNLSDCPNLKELKWHGGELTELDISKCSKLISLTCSNNKIVSLNLANLINLEGIYCSENKLTSLDLSDCPNLKWLECYNNQITDLNIQMCLQLKWLKVYNNSFATTEFANSIDFNNHPNLKKENVWWTVNAQDWLDWNYPETMRSSLKKLYIKKKKLSGHLDLSDFINLEELNCGNDNNQLTSLKLINLSKLKEVNCSWNQLTDLVLSNCPNLEKLECYNNPIRIKDVKISNCPKLTKDKIEITTNAQQWLDDNYPKKTRSKIKALNIKNSKLEGSLDLTEFTSLESLECSYNKLTNLNLSNCFNFSILRCSNNQLSSLILNCPNLIEIDCCDNQLTSLEFSDLKSLKNLNCARNKLSNLELRNCISLENLQCQVNQLTDLNLSGLNKLRYLLCSWNKLVNLDLINTQLTELECSDNYLKDLNFINISSPNKLKSLDIKSNDFASQNLTSLSKFINLENLQLGNDQKSKIQNGVYNRFLGSLNFLKNMVKLNYLNISNTDFDSGLEYLPESLNQLDCSTDGRPESKVSKLHEELFLYGGRLKAWKEAHPELMVEAWGKVSTDNFSYEKPLKVMVTTPTELLRQEKISNAKENNHVSEINYQEISLRDKRPFSWEINQTKLLSSEELPTRLYNLKEKYLENFRTGEITDTNHQAITGLKFKQNVKNYALLSYVWGKKESEDDFLSSGGRKALLKACEACRHLRINYLWIDQLCINQKSVEEKNYEVPQMQKYYDNSVVTLISINTNALIKENRGNFARETLAKIVNSEWFTRSWTYQEGWLSKQTIFMFDNVLIDGRIMAQIWEYIQRNDHNYWGLNKDPQTFITPLGWTYGKKEINWKDKANLGLYQALSAIKNRKRGIPIDGIYSILGLLPYGDKVIPKYKEWRHKYTKEELEEALADVMNEAVKLNPLEPLTWFGSRRNESNKWWIPKIDEKGSTNVQGSIKDYEELINYKPESIKLTENGIELTGSQHTIAHFGNKLRFFIRGDISQLRVYVTSPIAKLKEGTKLTEVQSGVNIMLDRLFWLEGATETLKKIKLGDILILPDVNKWKMNSGLAFLIPNESNSDCPIDVVRLDKSENFAMENAKEKVEEKKLFIDIVNKKLTELEKKEVQIIELGQKIVELIQKEGFAESIQTFPKFEKIKEGLQQMVDKFKEDKHETIKKNLERIIDSLPKEKDWKDINPNFTPELIKEWHFYNFTLEQCRDWINTSPPSQQTQAIKEPAYYAWLRDIKKVDNEWVLNHGDWEVLSQEFFEWYQVQLQAQIQIPPK